VIKVKIRTAILLLMLSFCVSAKLESLINWQEFNKASFNQARTENKFIILDLVAVWCHWCHVMEKSTYQDEKVVTLLNKHFIATKADHDLRPDLAERYRDWGWPATIVLTSDGTEIVKRAGFINPQNMVRLLQAIIDDPSPETTTLQLPKELSKTALISADIVKQLKKSHFDTYDNELGGLDVAMKFIDLDSVLWDLHLAETGNQKAQKHVVKTLDAALNLIDPAFGGAYQYSTHGDWSHPHYEKIMHTQYRYMRVYSQACKKFKKQKYCKAVSKVADYLLDFLYDKDKGVFYTSQDADLKQGSKAHDYFKLNRKDRLALGLPRIDKHKYAAHNGLAIEGMVFVFQATNKKKHLIAAQKAANWIVKNRSIKGGGFKHDKRDTAGPYLADTLYMGRAFLKLYEATEENKYLIQAQMAAKFIDENFKNPTGGLLSAVQNGTPAKPLPQLSQNIDASLFFMELLKQEPSAFIEKLNQHTMKLLATRQIVTQNITEAGVLLVNFAFNKK